MLLDEVDRELERRGRRFVRYADDCNIYVSSQKAGQRVMALLKRHYDKLHLNILAFATNFRAHYRPPAGGNPSACGKDWSRQRLLLPLVSAFSLPAPQRGRARVMSPCCRPLSKISVGSSNWQMRIFEVTLEPEHGSPTGKPTGPILAVGRMVALAD